MESLLEAREAAKQDFGLEQQVPDPSSSSFYIPGTDVQSYSTSAASGKDVKLGPFCLQNLSRAAAILS